jgi:hypothetical protein
MGFTALGFRVIEVGDVTSRGPESAASCRSALGERQFAYVPRGGDHFGESARGGREQEQRRRGATQGVACPCILQDAKLVLPASGLVCGAGGGDGRLGGDMGAWAGNRCAPLPVIR